jgi:hypothetical protein
MSCVGDSSKIEGRGEKKKGGWKLIHTYIDGFVLEPRAVRVGPFAQAPGR